MGPLTLSPPLVGFLGCTQTTMFDSPATAHRVIQGLRGWAAPRRSRRAGVLAMAGMAGFYTLVVGGLSGSTNHLADQISRDWYLLLPIVVGFGIQVGLIVELRARHALMGSAMGTGAAGAGSSTMGMVACCAHHVADLLPFLGATAAATFLYEVRVAFMAVGLGVNAIAISIAMRRLRRSPVPATKVEACAAG